LGKVFILESSKVFDKKIDKVKIMLRIIDLNEMAFTELVLSIDVSSSSGKMHLELSKAAKPKIIKTVMLVCLGKSQRRNMIQYLLHH
jgi:hypothetical protein